MASIEPALLYRETAPRRRAFLITQANFSDIGQRWWDLTRLGGPLKEYMLKKIMLTILVFVPMKGHVSRQSDREPFARDINPSGLHHYW